jgi:hypothetical protein
MVTKKTKELIHIGVGSILIVMALLGFASVSNQYFYRQVMERERHIQSLDECGRIQYRINNANYHSQLRRNFLLEQQNLILMGKCK